MTHEPPAARRATRWGDPALVLIVEDEEPLAELVSFVVQGAGYTARIALQGRQGLEDAHGLRPALLIVDLMLPYLDGAAVIAGVRNDAVASSTAAPPIILITATSLVQARAAGADIVLRKPFHLVDLEALLRRFLGPPPGVPHAAGSRPGAPAGQRW